MYLKVIAELREFRNFKARLPEASRCTSKSRSHLPLRQREIVIISTALFHGEASRRKSNRWLLRRVGPERPRQRRFITPVVTADVVDEDPFAGSVDLT